MNNKKILFLICFFFAFGVIIIAPTTYGVEEQKTKSTIADKDTYIDTNSPTSNYGAASNLWCGFTSSIIWEAYFHFSFSDKPENITKAELSLDIWGVTQTMGLTLSIINESWDELTLDWLNKPNHGQTIGRILAPSSDIYKYDITSLLTTRTEISICINMTTDDYANDYVFITSKEGYILSEDAPKIIWTYLETVPEVPELQIPGYNVLLILGMIGILGYFFIKKIDIKKS